MREREKYFFCVPYIVKNVWGIVGKWGMALFYKGLRVPHFSKPCGEVTKKWGNNHVERSTTWKK